ncbi:hypothetical protein KEM55_001986, partial [Ascosphaera atra]
MPDHKTPCVVCITYKKHLTVTPCRRYAKIPCDQCSDASLKCEDVPEQYESQVAAIAEKEKEHAAALMPFAKSMLEEELDDLMKDLSAKVKVWYEAEQARRAKEEDEKKTCEEAEMQRKLELKRAEEEKIQHSINVEEIKAEVLPEMEARNVSINVGTGATKGANSPGIIAAMQDISNGLKDLTKEMKKMRS